MDDKEYYLYMHTNKINNKRYIGITKQEPERRWGVDGSNYKESPHLNAAIAKYGWDNFEHTIMTGGLTKRDACMLEKYYIAHYNTQDRRFGYNVYEGGMAPSMPQESRDKIAQKLKGNQHCLGRVTSEETKRKISEAQKGRPFSEERKQKLRKPKSVTYPCSEEKRQHIIDAKKDKKPIICVETGVAYSSIHECARQMNLSATAICAVLRGRTKSTGGYHFEYNDI